MQTIGKKSNNEQQSQKNSRSRLFSSTRWKLKSKLNNERGTGQTNNAHERAFIVFVSGSGLSLVDSWFRGPYRLPVCGVYMSAVLQVYRSTSLQKTKSKSAFFKWDSPMPLTLSGASGSNKWGDHHYIETTWRRGISHN